MDALHHELVTYHSMGMTKCTGSMKPAKKTRQVQMTQIKRDGRTVLVFSDELGQRVEINA